MIMGRPLEGGNYWVTFNLPISKPVVSYTLFLCFFCDLLSKIKLTRKIRIIFGLSRSRKLLSRCDNKMLPYVLRIPRALHVSKVITKSPSSFILLGRQKFSQIMLLNPLLNRIRWATLFWFLFYLTHKPHFSILRVSKKQVII